MIKYVLFDLDGTLTDPKEGITKCVQHALRHFNIEKSCDELISFIGPPLKEQFMSYASLSSEEGETAVRIYRERFAPIGIFENRIYDGVTDMLQSLKNKGIKCAMATSKPTVFAKRISDKFGITPYLDLIEGSELDGRNTDKALVIKNAMKKLCADPSETVMVGDRIHDVIGSEKNKIPCIGVTYGYGEKSEFENKTCIFTASDVKELKEILLSM